MGVSIAAPEEPKERLPEGTYVAEFCSIERRNSSNGNPQIAVKLRVVTGEHTGAELADWITFTDKTGWRIRSLLEAVGAKLPPEDYEFASYDAMADWVAKAIFGRRTEIVLGLQDSAKSDDIDPQTGERRKYLNVVKYQQTAGSPVEGASDLDNDASDFNPNAPVSANVPADNEPLPF